MQNNIKKFNKSMSDLRKKIHKKAKNIKGEIIFVFNSKDLCMNIDDFERIYIKPSFHKKQKKTNAKRPS